MTREEAIRALERADGYVGIHYINGVEEAYINPHLREAVKVALSALRPVSREQVEKVFPGCPYCKPDSEGYVQKFGAYSILNGELKTGHCKPQKISFCPHCSRPLTDEAVEMVMEKINNMEEITNEH